MVTEEFVEAMARRLQKIDHLNKLLGKAPIVVFLLFSILCFSLLAGTPPPEVADGLVKCGIVALVVSGLLLLDRRYSRKKGI